MSLKTLSYNKGSSRSFAGGRNSAVSVPVGDPYWNQVELLLLGNGSNNQNNNVFLDSSSNNLTVTRNGEVTQTSFAPLTGTYSGYFSGTAYHHLELPVNSVFGFGTGDYTVECWINVSGTPGVNGYTVCDFRDAGAGTSPKPSFFITPSLVLTAGYGINTMITGPTLTKGVWYHIALVRQSGNSKLWVNGVQSGSTSSASYDVGTTARPIIGNVADNPSSYNSCFNGYITDFRVVKGTAIYTAAFTPPTTKLTAVTNTSLLLNFANAGILDSSTRKNTIFTETNTKISSSYLKYGNGSIAFNGTSSYIADIAGQSNFAFDADFTVELWAYHIGTTASILYDTRGTGQGNNYYVTLTTTPSSGTISFYYNAANQITATGVIVTNTWQHIALCRSNGVYRLFVNGTQVGSSYSNSNTTLCGPERPMIGRDGASSAGFFNGCIDDLRVTRAARYISNFIPPQAESLTFYSPPTYDEYTYNGATPVSGDPFYDSVQLLLRGNAANGLGNSTFIDRSSNNMTITRIGTVGQGSFAPYNDQFSGSFASGSYLTIPAGTAGLQFGSGDFTIEAWVYLTSNVATQCVISGQTNTADVIGSSFVCYVGGTTAKSDIYVGTSGGAGVTSPKPAANTWAHVAWVRNGSTWNSYLNGVLVESVACSGSINIGSSTYPNAIGALGSGTSPLTGFIADFRVVKGTALYTGSTFTPPTSKLTAVTNTSLLLNFDNVGIYDSTNKNNLATVGTAAISTVQVKYGAGSMYFDGSSYATASPSTALNLGSSNFTIEAWILSTGLGAERTIVAKHNNQAGNGEWALCTSATNFPVFYYSTTGTNLFSVTSNTAITAGTWHHVAITRSGSTFTIWLNGINCGTSADSSTIYASGTALNVGRYLATAATASPFLGWIDDIRITKGVARYTSNFTTPTAQLPNYYEDPGYDPFFRNVSLLLHGDGSNNQNNSTILDSSISNKTVTRVTGVSQGSFSPFPVAANVSEYSVSTNSGSLYFNGTNAEYCTVPASTDWVFAGDHTLECWVYITIAGGGGWIYSTGGSGTNDQFIISANNGGNNGSIAWAFALNGNLYLTTTANIPINQWNHIAISRTGTTMTAWVNGTNVYTGTISGSIGQNSTAHIGRRIDGNGSTYFTGYISNFRIINGTGLYTSNFTVPNVPLTSITNTKLLLKGENSAIYDSATKNNLIVSGDTKTMVAVNKFGGSSIYFDGTGDYVKAPHSTELAFGSTNFTVECWLYTPGTGNPSGVWGKKVISGYGIALANYLLVPSLTVSVNGTTWGINNSSSISLTANAWNHVAVVRNGDIYTIYVNGLSGWSGTLAGTVYDNSLPFVVGNIQDDTSFVYSGYIDDFRFTKGIARYTANFVPPTSAFRNR